MIAAYLNRQNEICRMCFALILHKNWVQLSRVVFFPQAASENDNSAYVFLNFDVIDFFQFRYQNSILFKKSSSFVCIQFFLKIFFDLSFHANEMLHAVNTYSGKMYQKKIIFFYVGFRIHRLVPRLSLVNISAILCAMKKEKP